MSISVGSPGPGRLRHVREHVDWWGAAFDGLQAVSMTDNGISWQDWSAESFEQARKAGRLVLLDLTASWCHWCHVMDKTTYSDPRVVKMIEENFVPVRVDIDMRPDISDRYNRGGFPTTAFLSDRGESVWGATYIPPSDMLRIMESVLKAKQSGEIDRALEMGRQHYLDISSAAAVRAPVSPTEADDMFEDLFAAYDVEHGGFGIQPKFPYPDMLDLVLMRHVSMSDDELGDAAANTLDRMAQGLYDRVEGGLFRYSVTRDWRTPHYEKMLDTNLGFLRNLVHAKLALGTDRFDSLARGTAAYLLGSLRDEGSGGFYGSQDADEEYYRLGLDGRRRRGPPAVDRTMYAGWNAQATTTMLLAGVVLSDEGVAEAGLDAWRMIMSRLWNEERHLVRHTSGQELYLLEDQVATLEALIAVSTYLGDDAPLRMAETLIEGVDMAFAHSEGGYGDVVPSADAIGALESQRKPVVENSRWALGLMQLSALTHRADLLEKARGVLDSLARGDIDAHGVFGAAFLIARTVLDRGPIAVEICSGRRDEESLELWKAAMSTVDPGIVVRWAGSAGTSAPFAVVCSSAGCSDRLSAPDALRERVKAEIRRDTGQTDPPASR